MNKRQEQYIRKIVKEEVQKLDEGLLASLIGKVLGKRAFKKLNDDPEYQQLKKNIIKYDREAKQHADEFNKLASELGINIKIEH